MIAEQDAATLPTGEWLSALYELSLTCAGSPARETRDRVREMNALLLCAPSAALPHGLRALGPARLEALLDAAAYETAVMTMLDRGAGFLLSRSGDGDSLATVALPGSLREKSGSAATPALALVCALALALSNAVPGGIARVRRTADARAALH